MTYTNLSLDAKIAGRCALVTGSTQGMGLAIARALAAQGCKLMLNGLVDAEAGERLRREIAEAAGVEVAFSGADLADREQIRELVAQTEQQLGPVDILVNNAATRNMYKLEDIPDEKWEHALAVNLSAPFYLVKHVLPGMKQKNWGRIVNIASNLGLTAIPNRADYVANKHGLVGLTRAAAVEGLPHRITVNAICPGSTHTPHAERQVVERMQREGKSREDAIADFLLTKQPSRRFVQPEQIGDLIVFLCSEAASEITGTPLSIDGGWMASA